MPPNWCCALVFLSGNAIFDVRRRYIHLPFTLAFAAVGVACSVIYRRTPGELAFAVAPGLLLFLISFSGSRAVGGGDGIAMMVLGLFLGVWEVLASCLLGFFLAAIPACLLFLRGRKEAVIPYLPFLWLGCLLSCWVCLSV